MGGRLVRVKTNAGDWMEVHCGAQSVVVSLTQPVAVVRDSQGTDHVVSWADLDVGARAFTATVMGSSTGAWVFYRPLASQDASIAAGSAAAVFVAVDRTVRRFVGLNDLQPVGATRHGLWTRPVALPEPTDERPSIAESPADVLGSGGSRTRVVVDRQVMFAFDDGKVPQIMLHASAPKVLQGGWGTTFKNRYLSQPLPTGALPSRIRISESAREVPEPELMESLAAMTIRNPENPPIETQMQWDRIVLSAEAQQEAVSAVLREFEHLANYWRAADGSTYALTRGLRDPQLAVSGDWPNTRVHVSFTHPNYSRGRLQRTLRVFDDAGRIIPSLYASVHLMEDLDTKPLPDFGDARPATLEI